MAERMKRSKIAWSDDLSYDSEEEREKERLLNAELAEIEAPEKPSYSEEELTTLISYVKQMTTLCFLKNTTWNIDYIDEINTFFLEPKNTLLVIYCLKGNFKCSLEIPKVPVLDLIYFLRKTDTIFTVDKFHDEVTCGTISGNIEKCLLKTLESIYAPLVLNTNHYPDNVKNELSSKCHLFLAKLTDFYYASCGLTIFYVPREGIEKGFDEVCENNNLIERLEEVIVYWIKQLKTCLEDNKNIPTHKELLCPIDEYEFWVYRNKNLSGVQYQLTNKRVCFIQEVLLNNHSSHIAEFQTLCNKLNECIYEAQSNISYLRLIIEPCRQIEELKSLKECSVLFSTVLNIFRVIWMNSPFFNTVEKLTDLYSYFSNQVILKCKISIDMKSLFNGRTKKAMEQLRESIECCVEYKSVYNVISESHNQLLPGSWNLDNKVIFNYIDSFIQRCVDMLEVCNCMVIFGRIDEVENMSLPKLSGTQGKQFEEICENLEIKFKKALKKIESVSHIILNVQEADWYDHIKHFNDTVQRIETMIENLLDNIFNGVNNAEEAIEVLCSMHIYSKRHNLKKKFSNKISKVWEFLSDEITKTKEYIVSEKNKQPSGIPSFSGQMITVDMQKNYVTYLKQKIVSTAWFETSNVTENSIILYSNLLNITQHIKKNKWKSFLELANINFDKSTKTTLISKYRMNKVDFLTCNINRNLNKILKELFFWQSIGHDMDESLQKINMKHIEIQQSYEAIIYLVKSYNCVLFSLSKKELQLLGPALSDFYESLEPAITKLNWSSAEHQTLFISSSLQYCKTKEVIDLFKLCNLNITTLISNISSSYARVDFSSKTFSLREFMECLSDAWENKIKHVLVLIKGIVFYISVVMKESEMLREVHDLLKIYIRYYDKLIEKALALNLHRSMHQLLDLLVGNAIGQSSVLRMKLSLENGQVIFNPSISEIHRMFSLILHRFISCLINIKTLSNIFGIPGAKRDFYFSLRESKEAHEIHSHLMEEVSRTLNNVEEHSKLWDKYKHIWELPKQEFLSTYERQTPSVSDIKKDIAGFKDLQSNVEAQDSKIKIDFIELDFSNLKQSISDQCSSWIKDFEVLFKMIADKDIKTVYSSLKKSAESVRNVSNTLSELQEALDAYDQLCVDVYQNEDTRLLTK